MAESRRQEWAARVQRWKESGLSATEFAAEMGLNPRTLSYWKWKLGRDARKGVEGASSSKASSGSRKPKSTGRKSKRMPGPSSTPAPQMVELVETDQAASPRVPGDAVDFELQTGDGRWRLRVPSGFDAEELRRLMAAMEGVQ